MGLILSDNLESLADQLIEEIGLKSPLDSQTVLVPNRLVKQWLLLSIAKKSGIAMGLRVIDVESFFSSRNNSLGTFCSLYSALKTSEQLEVISYLDGKKKRLLELTAQLSTLFTKYSQYELPHETSWQHDLFQSLFPPEKLQVQEPIICFGIDYLPPRFWNALMNAPALSIYLFSPCQEFWEDLCTDKERKKIWTKAPKKLREELDAYLSEGPRHLANFGKLGREALRHFEDFQSLEVYSSRTPTTLLKRLQYDLLHFQETKNPSIDSSIQVLLTGSSRLREIEALKEEILRLDIPYHEISVLAPDLEPYVPLIEYVFDKVPYLISGVDIATQSSFRQGLVRLLELGSGRWEKEELLNLFETPAFYRKKRWDAEILNTFRSWIASTGVKWGFDETHRKTVLQKILGEKDFIDEGSWEKGLIALLEQIVYLKPMHISSDLLEELISALFELRELELKGEKSLSDWAAALEKAADTFLLVDPNDEADLGFEIRFRNLLLEMKKNGRTEVYPFEVVMHFLSLPCKTEINGAKLHSVRFAPLKDGAQIPAKALFLIGMDEVSFPKLETPSSLDLLRGKTPKRADFDRYLFLQAIFSAKELLRISYGHLSADEGKPVGPSLLVQELIAITGPEIASIYPQTQQPPVKKHFDFPKFKRLEMPSGELVLSIKDLRQLARHPWRYYLQKTHQIFLDEDLEETFALQRGKQVSEIFEKGAFSKSSLPKPFQEAMDREVLRKVEERQAQLKEWQLEPISLIFKECSESKYREGNTLFHPALEIRWENLKVKLVGEIKLVTEKGIVSTQEDTIAGTLKIWPEALAAAIAMDAPQIWLLRSGKSRTLVNPQSNLKAFIEYLFCSLKAPSPLLPEWADSILRKNDLEKKMDRGSTFQDPVMDWMFARATLPTAEEMLKNWGPYLAQVFQDLIELYPPRKANAKV